MRGALVRQEKRRRSARLGITVAVDHRVDLALLLAVRAIPELIGAVALNIILREEGVDGNALLLRDGAEQRGDADHVGGVVLKALERAVNRLAGRRGSEQQEDALFLDHGLLDVLTEEQLTRRQELRRDDADVALLVHAVQRGLAQGVREERADDLAAVHADNGVDACIVFVEAGKGLSGLLGSHAVALDSRNIDIVTDMGMVRRKMTGNHAEGDVFIPAAYDLDASVFHGISPFELCWCGFLVLL